MLIVLLAADDLKERAPGPFDIAVQIADNRIVGASRRPDIRGLSIRLAQINFHESRRKISAH